MEAVLESGPGWYESSWDLLRGLDVREEFAVRVQPGSHAPPVLGLHPGYEPEPSAT